MPVALVLAADRTGVEPSFGGLKDRCSACEPTIYAAIVTAPTRFVDEETAIYPIDIPYCEPSHSPAPSD